MDTIKREINELEEGRYDIEEINSRIEELEEEYKDVLENEKDYYQLLKTLQKIGGELSALSVEGAKKSVKTL